MLNTRVGRDGKVRSSDGAQGRLRASDVIAAQPNASLREIAAKAGVAIATARDVRSRLARGEDPLPPRQRAAVPRPLTAEPPPAPGSGAPAPERGGRTPAVPDDGTLSLIMQSLRRDPSLRLSEAGRAMLRLLDLHAIPANAWNRLVDQVPAHWTHHMVQAARECIAAWQWFADELERRSEESA